MITIVGNVAGRVWQFCRASAFRGFYAGGGPGYQINGAQLSGEGSGAEDPNAGELREPEPSLGMRRSTCIQTQFPDGTLNEKYIAPDDTPPRPAKRIQREKGTDELRSHWIMVSSSETPNVYALDVSPSRGTGNSETEKLGPKLGPAHARPATSRLGRRHGHSPSKLSTGSHAGSPGLHARGPASFASTRASSSPSKKDNIDASIHRFNRQLKAMIREGREALGTRFEVEDELDDDGLEAGIKVDYFT